MRKQLKIKALLFYLVVALAIVSLVTFAIYTLNSEITFYKTIEEVYHDAETKSELFMGETVRVGGIVEMDSLKRVDDSWFFIIKNDNTQTINVEYRGVLPDLFSENVVILADGNLSAEETSTESKTITLQASQILTKHDENYQPKY